MANYSKKKFDFPSHCVQSLDDFTSLIKGEGSFQFNYKTDNFSYTGLLQRAVEPRLFVLLHGSKVRSVSRAPYFDRWSWGEEFPGNVLNFSDPSLDLNPEIELAWFAGNRNEHPLRIVEEIVSAIASAMSIPSERIYFYGSSGGGFCALMLASMLNGSNAIAINPQTRALKYHERAVKDMLGICFPKTTLEEARADLSDRLDAIKMLGNARSSKALVLQNRLDKFHYAYHFLPLFYKYSTLEFVNRFIFSTYESEKGHGPESRDMVHKILTCAMKLSQDG